MIPPALQITALGLHLLISRQPLRLTGISQLPFAPEGMPLWGQGLVLLLNSLGISIVYTWLYRGTRGSTLLAILFHAAGNTSAVLLGSLVSEAADPSVYLFGTGLNWLLALVLLQSRRVEEAGFATD